MSDILPGIDAVTAPVAARLLAAIEKTERVARDVKPLGHTYDMGGNRMDEEFVHSRLKYHSEDGTASIMPDAAAEKHFAAHGPDVIQRRCAAVREIVELATDDLNRVGPDGRYVPGENDHLDEDDMREVEGRAAAFQEVLRVLARIYGIEGADGA